MWVPSPQEEHCEGLEPSLHIHSAGRAGSHTSLMQRRPLLAMHPNEAAPHALFLCSPQSSTALLLAPGVSGSVPRWRSGQGGGRRDHGIPTFPTLGKHGTHSGVAEAGLQGPGRVNRSQDYLLTEKREGKP